MRPPSELAAVLPTLPRLTMQAHGYRIIAAQYLQAMSGLHPVRFFYGLGATKEGQRFTPKGGMPTIYLADTLETAFAEANPVQAIVRAVDPALAPPTPPGAYAAIRYHLDSVLDVTDPDVQAALGTDRAELMASWRTASSRGQVTPTQQLGQAAFDSGLVQALWYESVRAPGAFCLAVFPDRLIDPAFLEVYDPTNRLQERLP